MLHDLVKLAIRQGHNAKIESGGINLNGVFYSPSMFPQLPDDLQPHHTRVLTNSKGNIIFSGEYAYLSNMYPCNFTCNRILFTSTEQCFQFEKAQFHNKEHKAHQILTTNDPFVCKQIGDSIERSREWNKVQLAKTASIQKLKFNQHPRLKLDAIKSIQIYKSSALDNLPSRLVKDAFMILCTQLQHIFNLSLETRT